MCGAVAGETLPDLQRLLIQVRRASAADQVEVSKWLRAKFLKL
jgi:hypothetical protein